MSKTLHISSIIARFGETISKIATSILIALILGSISITAVAKTTVRVSGSTTVEPLGEALAEAFNNQSSDYQVLISSGGTGAGITDAGEGRSDIAMASREVTSDEKTKYKKN